MPAYAIADVDISDVETFKRFKRHAPARQTLVGARTMDDDSVISSYDIEIVVGHLNHVY